MPEIDLYRQVAVASGSRLVFIAGQVSWGLDDVAKLTVYLVDWTPDKIPLTGIGVAALAEPDLLVEIDATAVLD